MGTDLLIGAINPIGPVITCAILGNAAYSRSGKSSGSSGTGGGWQVVDRALQAAAVEWMDYNPWVMTLPLMLDGGTGTPRSVEAQIATIEGYETIAPGTQPPRPAVLGVTGPVPHTDVFWVCGGITWTGGETGAIRDPITGERTQQSFALTLIQYLPSTVTISGLSPAEQAALAAAAPGQ